METKKAITQNKTEQGTDPYILADVLERSHQVTEYKKVENNKEGEIDIENKLRLESFKKFSPEMKKALSYVSGIFKKLDGPWAIHGSTALVLEAETSKQPVDIDISFADVDYNNVFSRFKELERQGILSKLEPKELIDPETGLKNGCTRIYAKIKVNENPDDDIEIEAFAQNIDPKAQKNGITNPGYDKMTIMKYSELEGFEAEDLELNFASREENFKFYLQIAAIELQKYHLDNALKEGGMKNKFPQRLNNILAIIKRREREELIKSGALKLEDNFDFENVTEGNILELVKEFREHNDDIKVFSKLSETVESKLHPVDVLFLKYAQFQKASIEGVGEHKGFVGEQGREKVLDDLTKKNLMDMEGLGNKYKNLQGLKKEFETWVHSCKDGCEDFLRESILKKKDEILKKTKQAIETILKTKEDYELLLGEIDYQDKRDFIPYIAIKETLDSYINQSLSVAENLKKEVENTEVKVKVKE